MTVPDEDDAGPSPGTHPPVAVGLAAREVAGSTAGAALLGIVGSVFDGLTAILTSRVLGPEGRGVYAVTLTVAAFAAVTACLGVTTAARVLLASSPPRVTMGQYLGAAPLHVIGGAVTGLLVTAGLVLGVLRTGSWVLVVSGATVAAGLTMSAFVFDGLHAVGRHKRATGTNTIGSLVALVGSAVLAAAGQNAASGYLLALSLSLVVQVVVGVAFLYRAVDPFSKYSWKAHRLLLRSGISALPYLSSTLVTFRLDRYLVASLASVGSAGIYSVAATMAEAVRQLPNALGQVLLFGQASGRISFRLERRARASMIAMVSITMLVIGVTAEPLVRGLFGSEFSAAVGPLRILLLGEVFMAVWLLDSRLLIGAGRLGSASATTMLSAGILLVGDLILIPLFGIEGAATASALAYASAMGAAIYMLAVDRDSARGGTGRAIRKLT